MFRTLTIEGYRGIDKLAFDNLARVNLLVGQNNCGKTSVLEALELVLSNNPINTVLGICRRRGDLKVLRGIDGRDHESAHAMSIMPQHAGAVSPIKIIFTRDTSPCELKVRITAAHTLEFELLQNGPMNTWRHILRIGDGGVAVDHGAVQGTMISQVLPTFAIYANPSVRKVRSLISEVKASGESARLESALNEVIPGVSSVEMLDRNDTERSHRAGVFAIANGCGTSFAQLGDGSWQTLAIAAGLVASRGGVFLVDEFDSGIHYSKLTGLWKFIRKVAEDLNVLVFATTHSEDCVRAFAQVAEESAEGDLALYRIERRESGMKAVRFGKEELTTAMDYQMEVR